MTLRDYVCEPDGVAMTLINVSLEEFKKMQSDYDRRGTCACPRCGVDTQPWAGMWVCGCGAAVSAAWPNAIPEQEAYIVCPHVYGKTPKLECCLLRLYTNASEAHDAAARHSVAGHPSQVLRIFVRFEVKQ